MAEIHWYIFLARRHSTHNNAIKPC